MHSASDAMFCRIASLCLRFLGGLHTLAGAMTPKFELGRDFCAMHLPQISSSYVYSVGSYRVDTQTNPQTNKQTPPKTSNVLRYATTLGNSNYMCHMINSKNVCDLQRTRHMCPDGGLSMQAGGIHSAVTVCLSHIPY